MANNLFVVDRNYQVTKLHAFWMNDYFNIAISHMKN